MANTQKSASSSGKKTPTGAPELSDEAKKLLDDQREVPLPELADKSDEQPVEQESADVSLDEPSELAGRQSPLDEQPNDGKKHRLKKFFAGFWRRKKWTLPLTLLVILGVLLALPWTRYPMLSSFVTNLYSVKILDSKNGTPISGVTIELDNRTAVTDVNGEAKIRAHIGKRVLHVSKKYYQDATSDVFVGLKSQAAAQQLQLAATGRQVPLSVVDKLSGKPIANADIKVLDTSAKTDAMGKATIVLPTKHASEKAVVTAAGYNLRNTEVQITDKVVDANTLSLVPAGRVYFLSNRSGMVDVVSANFDGSNRKTVAAGTGSEDSGTQLYVSPDQKHLMLYAKRNDAKDANLYIIDSATGNVSDVDSSSATFAPVGWSGTHFVYEAYYQDVHDWQPHQQAFKSYDALSGKITTLDQTDATGKQYLYARQTLGSAYLIGDSVIYSKLWQADQYNQLLKNKKDQLLSIAVDGSNRRTLKDLPISPTMQYAYIDSVRPKPNVVYFEAIGDSGSTYYKYQDGNVTNTNTVTSNDLFKAYPLYFISPNGQHSLWTEKRDGQSVLFVGEANGDNETEVATLDGFTAYGWNGNNYLLVSKGGSQLYILPSSGLAKDRQPMKVSDFYGPGNFR